MAVVGKILKPECLVLEEMWRDMDDFEDALQAVAAAANMSADDMRQLADQLRRMPFVPEPQVYKKG